MKQQLLKRPGGTKLMIGLLWFQAIGITGYWLSFFTGGEVNINETDSHLIFQSAFPAPDATIVICAILCAEGLRRGKEWFALWGLVCAGGTLFLGVIDAYYTYQYVPYSPLTGPLVLELMIQTFCITFALGLATFTWRNRHSFGFATA